MHPNFTGAVIKSFSDALQTSLAFKTKLVSDLEDNFIQPLQQFVKTYLKEFKAFRKQHEKALERYETQLARYSTQSKTKEASAVREEAFQLHVARKSYVRMSGQHVLRILHFRSLLEHVLVERFSSATMAHMTDLDGTSEVWQKLDVSLASWRQWLIDDKDTCEYQLYKLQMARKELQAEYIAQTKPVHDLERYTAANASASALNSRHSLDFSTATLRNEKMTSYKWGYLFMRGSRNYWYRKWFFLYDGYFGSCNVNPTPKLKGAITVSERVSVLLCDIKPLPDADRRFCFEVMCAQQAPFVLQAETEEEMRDWLTSFEKAKRFQLQNEQPNLHANQVADNDQRTLSESDKVLQPALAVGSLPSNASVTSSSAVSVNVPGTPNPPASNILTKGSAERPSIVMLSTSPDSDKTTLSNSTSLTPLLVWEAARSQPTSQPGSSSPPVSPMAPSQSFAAAMAADASTNSNNAASQPQPAGSNSTSSSSWGIPWTLVPSMFQSGADDGAVDHPQSPVTASQSMPTDVDGHQVIWPARPDDSNVPKVDLVGYSTELEARNRELRRLFGGVSQNEVVLDAFIGLLKKKPLQDVTTLKEPEVPMSPSMASPVDTLEQEFSAHLADSVKAAKSEFGYSYTGRGFITQETFWFYSCVLMTCVNTVAIRLKDIKNIRLIRDPSINNTGDKSNIALAIDIASNSNDIQSPLILTTLMEDIEVVAEKLRFAVDNAKNAEPTPLQTMYDVIHNLSAAMGKRKNNNNQVTTIIKSEPTKARSSPELVSSTSSTSSSTPDIHNPEPVGSPLPSKSKKKLRKTSGGTKPIPPKSGALAAAMMAATVAGGSGFFDVSRVTRMEEDNTDSQKQIKAEAESGNTSDEARSGEMASTTTTTLKNESTATGGDAIPSHIQIPSGPISCGCDEHLDKIESEIELPISAKTLFDLMFSDEQTGPAANGGIWERKTAVSGSRDLKITNWNTVDGNQQRVLNYVMPVNNPMVKVKEADVVETQVVMKKEDYLRYVVQISTKAAQLPYADTFVPSLRYCISWVSKSQCKLTFSTGVKFVKSTLVKSMISKAAFKGMADSIGQFSSLLEEEANTIASKTGGAGKDNLLRPATSLKRSAHVSMRRDKAKMAAEKQKEEKQGWWAQVESAAGTVLDLLTEIPLYIGAAVGAIFLLWMMWVWLRAGSRAPSSSFSSSMSTGAGNTQTGQVVSRAVYLRDVEEGLLKTELQPAYVHTDSFRLFSESRLSNGTDHHRWFSSRHHQLAVELLFSRERLAMLRHDTLVIFQLLNEVDAQLLENEYMNWLLDTRLQCQTGEASINCEKIHKQLRAFFV
ncbi:SNF1-interacting protein [Apophysomyces ossiformis]|uniref:SNF1-interacting protein n=1 Tax=Apophysomyces ossiformis TaxID=679940 RepID=A0A8H7BZI1_9FUNG|nr:SNF1-interacting protein [Apophysomyces ossiformis]